MSLSFTNSPKLPSYPLSLMGSPEAAGGEFGAHECEINLPGEKRGAHVGVDEVEVGRQGQKSLV